MRATQSAYILPAMLAILATHHRGNVRGLGTLYLIEHIVNPTGPTPASVVVFSLRFARLAITLLSAFLKRFLVNVFRHCPYSSHTPRSSQGHSHKDMAHIRTNHKL